LSNNHRASVSGRTIAINIGNGVASIYVHRIR
jgi:hypothetical protein